MEDPLEDPHHPSGQESKLDKASEGNEENGTRGQKDSQNISNELNANEDDKRQPIMNSTLLELCFGPVTEMQEEPSKQKKLKIWKKQNPMSEWEESILSRLSKLEGGQMLPRNGSNESVNGPRLKWSERLYRKDTTL